MMLLLVPTVNDQDSVDCVGNTKSDHMGAYISALMTKKNTSVLMSEEWSSTLLHLM